MKPRDNCAVAIDVDGGFTRTVAYFRWEDSCVLYQLFRDKLIEGPCYIKVKKPVSKFSRCTGPVQSVWIGLQSVSSKEDPLEHPYVILINIHEYECQQQNQPRKKFFRDRLMWMHEWIFIVKDIYSNLPFSQRAQ